MKKHNKLQIASQILLSAIREYESAENDVDYVKCILQAGAAINLCYPIIVEYGGTTTLAAHADRATTLLESEGMQFTTSDRKLKVKRFIAANIFVYNALKHTGNSSQSIAASDDIFFDADLKEEAEELIRVAIDDFKKVPHLQSEISQFDEPLLDILWPSPSVTDTSARRILDFQTVLG